MDNFDKWFLIIVVSVAVILFILWAVWVGYSLNELIEASKEFK